MYISPIGYQPAKNNTLKNKHSGKMPSFKSIYSGIFRLGLRRPGQNIIIGSLNSPASIRIYKRQDKNIADKFMHKVTSCLERSYKEKPLREHSYEVMKGIEEFINIGADFLHIEDCRKFLFEFLDGIEDDYSRDYKLCTMGENFKKFVQKSVPYFLAHIQSREQYDDSIKMKCSYKDIANKSGKIEGESLCYACKLVELDGSGENLKKYLELAKDDNGNIVSSNVDKISRLVNALSNYHNLSLLFSKIPDNPHIKVNGLIDGGFIDCVSSETNKYTKDYEILSSGLMRQETYVTDHYGYKTTDEILKDYLKEDSSENLFLPQTICKLFEDFEKNKLFSERSASTRTANILNKEIDGYDKLLLIIPDIVKDEKNKEAYNKMIDILSKIKNIDYNQKDAHGTSFIEKVIMSENKQLLDLVIKSGCQLEYDPKLELVCEGIENEKFRNNLKNLNVKFSDLEEAAMLCEPKAIEKLSSQLKSPLCDIDKEILLLWNIAKEQEFSLNVRQKFGQYLYKTYLDEISTETMFTLMKETR